MFSEHWTEELKNVDTVPAVNSHETHCSWLLPVNLGAQTESTLLLQDEVN